MTSIEGVGPQFNGKDFFKARDIAHGLLSFCAQKAAPGMEDGDLQLILDQKAKELGVEKWWHPTKIRFGTNTLCSFRDTSQPHVKLQEGDLFFLDIGPVLFGHEADLGQTYRLGDPNFENPAEKVFHHCKKIWKDKGLKGEQLYSEAQSYALELGLELNPKMAGHRLGDFPHALHYRGSLESYEETPKPDLWILEIHLLGKNEGYFFEDLL